MPSFKPLDGDVPIGHLAYGIFRLTDETTQDIDALICTALDCGINLIDTADIYGFGTPLGMGGCEKLIGEAFKLNPGLRKKTIIATKGGIIPGVPYDSSYDYLMKAIDASLKRLALPHVDLYQIHRPDIIAPFHETARA